MRSNTKFFQFLKNFKVNSISKFILFEKNFSLSIFFLFLGFICGNLFGTFLNFFRSYLNWDGAIITATILIIEIINYCYYKTNKKLKTLFIQKKIFQLNLFLNKFFNLKKLVTFSFLEFPIIKKLLLNDKKKRIITKPILLKLINFYKMGLLLGFFIDAFKVGS